MWRETLDDLLWKRKCGEAAVPEGERKSQMFVWGIRRAIGKCVLQLNRLSCSFAGTGFCAHEELKIMGSKKRMQKPEREPGRAIYHNMIREAGHLCPELRQTDVGAASEERWDGDGSK